MPLFVLRARVYAPCICFIYGFPTRLCILPTLSGICFFVILSFLFVVFVLFLLLCSRWRFVDIPLIFSVQQTTYRIDNLVYILLGMVEARSVNVKKIHTHQVERVCSVCRVTHIPPWECVTRARICAMHPFYLCVPCPSVHPTYPFWYLLFCYSFLSFGRFCLIFVTMLSLALCRYSSDIFCPADHVPD